MKKILSLVLALTIVLGLCACGGNKTNTPGGELTADGRVKLTIGVPTNALVMDLDNNALTKWVEEECGVEIEFQQFAAGSEIGTQISTSIAAQQQLPDMIIGANVGEKFISKYGKDGYFVDLTDFYEDRDGASKVFWDRVENEMNEYEQAIVNAELYDPATGRVYVMPTIETSLIDKMQFQPWINTEWLDKVGLDMPTNIDELYEVLVAFKTKDPNGNGLKDEIPLLGSETGGTCAHVVDWIINMFCYYNSSRPYEVDENGKLSLVVTSDAYREALKFVNKLYKEGLLTTLAWSASSAEIKQLATPSSGVAMAGIFVGHLTIHTAIDNEVMYQYKAIPYWGNVVRNDMSFTKANFITETAEQRGTVEKCFEVAMKFASWDGSMRARYGEFGVNWDMPDEGSKSDLGLDATFKIIRDPLKEQNTVRWGSMGPAVNIYAEMETAQIADNMSKWGATKSAMHAESYQNFLWAEENNNPDEIVRKLYPTAEEEEQIEAVRKNVKDKYNKAQTDFGTGVLNPNNDADWNKYIQELESLGLNEYTQYLQMLYDRS